MDCRILSAAHNATITGPKCRVCAALTIEMRQSVDTENPHYIVSPEGRGQRFSRRAGRDECVLVVPQRQRRVTVWFQHQSPNGFWKANGDQTQGVGGGGGGVLEICAILVHLSAAHRGQNRQTWHPGHIWFPVGDETVKGWQHCSTPPCPTVSASVGLIVRHPLALFR